MSASNFLKNTLRLFLLFLFAFLPYNLFSYVLGEANFRYPTRLNYITTEHFKIIYPSGQEKFANLLSEYAEKDLEYINSYFGSDWQPKDFCITITTDNKDFNAYYFANHVIMFNTVSGLENSIYPDENFSDVLLHELGHAYILNHFDNTRSFFNKLIGEPFDNSIYLNQMVIEGLSVALESSSGAGRLNSPLFVQKLQVGAKKGVLPNYRHLSGAASDTYPYAYSSYLLGGVFFEYLRREYGVEKFHNMIEKIKCYAFFPRLIYDVYGIPLETLFDKAKAELKTPEEIETKDFTLDSSRYSLLVARDDEVYFYNSLESCVYLSSKGKTKAIIEKENVVKLVVSSNGTYIIIVSGEPNNYKMHLYERNIGNYRMKYVINNVENATFIKSDFGYYIALLKYDNSLLNEYFEVIDLLSQEKKATLNLGNFNVVSMCEADYENFAFIMRDSTNYSIIMYNPFKNKIETVVEKSEYILSSLSNVFTGEKIIFSYGEKKPWNENQNYMRFGFLEKSKDVWIIDLCNDNLEGGVLSPAYSNGKVIYIADDYYFYKIKYIEYDKLQFKRLSIDSTSIILTDDFFLKSTKSSKSDIVLKTKKGKNYNSFLSSMPFVNNHLLTPSLDLDSESNFCIGISNLSSDASEQMHTDCAINYFYGNKTRLQGSFNYIMLSKEFEYAFSFLPSLKFDDSVEGFSHFDSIVFTQAKFNKYFVSNLNYFTTTIGIGYDFKTYKSAVYEDDGIFAFMNFAYQDIKRKGYGYNCFSGFKAEIGIRGSDSNSYFKSSNMIIPNLLADFDIKFYIPRLIPIKNTRYKTFSVPTIFSFDTSYLLNNQDINSLRSKHSFRFGFSADFILYSLLLSESDIDSPFLLNNFVLDVLFDFDYSNYAYKSKIHNGIALRGSVRAYFEFTPSFLGLAFSSINRIKFGVMATLGQQDIGSPVTFSVLPIIQLSI